LNIIDNEEGRKEEESVFVVTEDKVVQNTTKQSSKVISLLLSFSIDNEGSLNEKYPVSIPLCADSSSRGQSRHQRNELGVFFNLRGFFREKGPPRERTNSLIHFL
jgi:hypothetical protein